MTAGPTVTAADALAAISAPPFRAEFLRVPQARPDSAHGGPDGAAREALTDAFGGRAVNRLLYWTAVLAAGSAVLCAGGGATPRDSRGNRGTREFEGAPGPQGPRAPPGPHGTQRDSDRDSDALTSRATPAQESLSESPSRRWADSLVMAFGSSPDSRHRNAPAATGTRRPQRPATARMAVSRGRPATARPVTSPVRQSSKRPVTAGSVRRLGGRGHGTKANGRKP